MEVIDALEIIGDKEGTEDQYSMAETLGVSQGTISNYMKGNKYPNLRTAGKIYGHYGLVVEPFTEKAVKKEWAYIEEYEL